MVRAKECDCGNDSYEKGWSHGKPSWKCANCNEITSRIRRRRKKTGFADLDEAEEKLFMSDFWSGYSSDKVWVESN